MKWDIESPCKSCPYRKDSPLALWDRYEFENLLKHDADPMQGAVFGCHATRHRPREEQGPCAGWLLDQKRRGTPSIQLRLRLMRNEEAGHCYENVSEGGLELYETLQEMCEVNLAADDRIRAAVERKKEGRR